MASAIFAGSCCLTNLFIALGNPPMKYSACISALGAGLILSNNTLTLLAKLLVDSRSFILMLLSLAIILDIDFSFLNAFKKATLIKSQSALMAGVKSLWSQCIASFFINPGKILNRLAGVSFAFVTTVSKNSVIQSSASCFLP